MLVATRIERPIRRPEDSGDWKVSIAGFLRRAWLPMLAIGASLLAAEGALRLVPRPWSFKPDPRSYVGEHPNRPSANFISDPQIGWRMVPGIAITGTNQDSATAVYLADSLGFRYGGKPRSAASRPRVVLVGDSFTFGVGVDYDHTFGSLLEAATGVSVINLGMPGFGIDQMWMTLRAYALPLRPALVVVGFVDDDFDRSLTAYRQFEGFNKPTFVLDAGRLRPATASDRPNLAVRLLDQTSSLWVLARVVLRRVSYTRPVGTWWALNSAILDAMQADCNSRGVPVVFVRIPSQGTRPRFRVLRQHFRAAGMSLLDLADPGHFGEGIFFPRDGHINARGHALVAAQLLAWLRSHQPSLTGSPAQAGL